MNKQKFVSSLIGALLTFLAVLGSLGCLASGMELSYDLQMLALGCVVMSLSFSLFWNTKLWQLPLCVAALLLGYWWQEGTLRLSMETALYQISRLYDLGYGWGVLQWSDPSLLDQSSTAALLALGAPIAALVSLSLTKGRLNWMGCISAIVPLAACMLLKDTVPQTEYLAILLFTLILILMTTKVRKRSYTQANTLTLTLFLPLTLALTLLFVFYPEDNYHMQNGAQKLEDMVLTLFDQAEVSVPFSGDQAYTVTLSNVGQRKESRQTVMRVTAPETGTLYLRGCYYDIYDGKTWKSTPGWSAWDQFYGSTDNAAVNKLEVQTQQVHSVLYFTYDLYGSTDTILGGRLRNQAQQKEYTIYYQTPKTYDASWDEIEDDLGGQQLSQYLNLPDRTRKRAMNILTKRVGVPTPTSNAGQIWRNANYIANWVSQQAKYDLNTPKMPADAEDFALWFLEESDTGYCTHYASAAVVLLRAAGIPARYVTGYLVNAKANRAVPVTQDNAHTWVEVFINGIGWIVLEPTPGMQIQRPDHSNSTIDPTIDVPESSVPTQATEPTQTTVTHTTAPTEQTDTATHATIASQTTMQSANTSPAIPKNEAFGKIFLWLLSILAGIFSVFAQWRIRVAMSKRRRGTPNQQALALWQQVHKCHRLLKQSPPTQMQTLAEKARFSQHTLTDQELHQLQAALTEAHKQLKKKNILWQLIYTVILAIY